MSEPEPTRQDRRRQAILAKACEAFLCCGYASTTMSAIAADLGGSKTTLWSYFRNKEALFAAVVDDLVDRFGEALRLPLPADGDPAYVLRRLGNSIMRAVTRPEIMALHRLVIGEACRSPHLGRVLWERGVGRGQQRVADWLTGQTERGILSCSDPLEAGRQFVGLCQSGSYNRHLIGGAPRPTSGELGHDVDRAIEVFLAAYRV